LKGFKKISGFGGENTSTFGTKSIPDLKYNSIKEQGMKLLDYIGAFSIGDDCQTPTTFESFSKVNGLLLKKFQGFIPPHVVKSIKNLIL
jgi:hypothetical protein